MEGQKGLPAQVGIVHLVPLFVLAVVAAAAVGLILIYLGVIKNPISNVVKIPVQAQVDLKADYKNPLSKTTQYLNPFSSYKNPFDTLK